MTSDVKAYIDLCDVCQRVKIPRHRLYKSLQSLPQSSSLWEEITADFIVLLLPSKRNGVVYNMILVVIDQYTKMAIYIPTTNTINASEFADLFVNYIITKYSVPKGIITDRGSIFMSVFWSEICFQSKVKRRLSTAYYPQTDRQTEQQNQTLEHYLYTYCTDNQDNWAGLLPLAEFAYNNAKHITTNDTPFHLLYNYHS